MPSAPRVPILRCLSDSRPTWTAPGHLCLACGLCCDGVIFDDVQLRPGDDAMQLQRQGLRLNIAPAEKLKSGRGASARVTATGRGKFCQPCVAFDGSRCRIYGSRPVHCRDFECLLLKKFRRGRINPTAALREIRLAKEQAEKVRALLRRLGDTNEEMPLATRFRRTRERLEASTTDATLAEIYADLTIAVHDLNLVLSESLYPG
ncbi:MAG TPA: YkgJ family cysteine cluster protein [Verrucomicrobiae bacterium]